MRATAVLALTVVAVSAQVQNYTSSLDMTLPDPGTVDDKTRASWCTAESNSCTTLCNKDASTNECDFTTLEYECKCGANDSAPGLQYYEQTMPTFICKELFSQCITQNANDAEGQDACTTNINDLCGTLNPNKAETGGGSGDDDEGDDGGDDGGDSEEPSDTGATAPAPSATGGGDSQGSENEDADDFAAPTAAPIGAAAMAALGLAAVLV